MKKKNFLFILSVLLSFILGLYYGGTNEYLNSVSTYVVLCLGCFVAGLFISGLIIKFKLNKKRFADKSKWYANKCRCNEVRKREEARDYE